MKKYIIIIIILSLSAILYGGITNYSDMLKTPDIIEIDNSIIIGGLIMESDDENDANYPGDMQIGKILYDDYFDDTLIEFDGVNKAQTAKNELAKLRSKDKRWHLKKYKILKGDTVGALSARFGIHEKILLAANSLHRGDIIVSGKTILIPSRNGVYHIVKNGENLGGIAAAYNVSAKSITEQNRIVKNSIRSGSRIFIPGGSLRADSTDDISEKKGSQAESAPLAFIWPMKGKITSGFGIRKDPFTKKRSFHNGIDISANSGTPVLAAADGTVIFSGWKDGYGNMVVIRHDKGYITVYAHNSSNLAASEKVVRQGETIAYSGMTGAVTGAHLHFELRKIDRLTPLNPMRFIK